MAGENQLAANVKEKTASQAGGVSDTVTFASMSAQDLPQPHHRDTISSTRETGSSGLALKKGQKFSAYERGAQRALSPSVSAQK